MMYQLRSNSSWLRILVAWAIAGFGLWLAYQMLFGVQARSEQAVQARLGSNIPFETAHFWEDGEMMVCLEAEFPDKQARTYKLSDYERSDWVVLAEFRSFDECVAKSRG